ncbi:MAG: insulinase family protein, partial [Pseudomonadota bacterium]
TGRGHGYAMSAAASRITPLGALSLRWNGLSSIQQIKTLDDALKGSDEALARFADKLARIHEAIKQAPRQFLLIGEEDAQAELTQTMAAQWQNAPAVNADFQAFALPTPEAGLVRQAWQTSTQVNFCAKAYTAVPSSHADTPAFMVLGGFLRNGFLHRAIREQGGAYGAGAGYDADSGAFRFFSYRDPRLEGTLEDFDNSIAWLLEKDHPARELEEAILGVISGIDQPGSQAGEARDAFFSNLHGRTPEIRRDLRSRILGVTMGDLKRVGEKYLNPENANIAVISDAATLEKQAEALRLEIRQV